MPIDIDQAIAKYQQAINGLKQDIELALEATALEGWALVQRRLISSGKDSEGQQFKPYSKNVLPWFYFDDVPVVRKVKDKEKDDYPDGISYDDWKTLIGRNAGFRNFKLTGTMFSKIGLVERKNESGKHVVVIGGRTKEVQDRMRYNDEITPGWINLSKEEQEICRKNFISRMTEAINKRLK